MDPELLRAWQADLRDKNYAERTIYSRVSIANGFLAYLGMPRQTFEKAETLQQETRERVSLSRSEYLLLLETARFMGRKRAYLLIKTIVNTGLKTQELPQLTVETLQRETTWITTRGIRRCVPIVELLRRELLAYAAEAGITKGPIYITKEGTPMGHSGVWKVIKQGGRRTGIPEEKGNPRTLHHLYLSTYRDVSTESTEQTARLYRELLDREEKKIAWNR